VPKLAALILVAAIFAAACGGESDTPPTDPVSPGAPTSTEVVAEGDLAPYVQELQAIDGEWQAGVDAAFEGREFLRTGALPDDFEPTTAALNSFLEVARGNLEELIDVTNTAIEKAQGLEVPSSATGMHAEYLAVLNGFAQRWSNGLAFIDEGDAEGFLRFYVTFQPEREALEQTLEASRAQREDLDSGS